MPGNLCADCAQHNWKLGCVCGLQRHEPYNVRLQWHRLSRSHGEHRHHRLLRREATCILAEWHRNNFPECFEFHLRLFQSRRQIQRLWSGSSVSWTYYEGLPYNTKFDQKLYSDYLGLGCACNWDTSLHTRTVASCYSVRALSSNSFGLRSGSQFCWGLYFNWHRFALTNRLELCLSIKGQCSRLDKLWRHCSHVQCLNIRYKPHRESQGHSGIVFRRFRWSAPILCFQYNYTTNQQASLFWAGVNAAERNIVSWPNGYSVVVYVAAIKRSQQSTNHYESQLRKIRGYYKADNSRIKIFCRDYTHYDE